MADVKKTVEIALKIVGADTKTLKTVVSSFEAIQKAVDSATKAVDGFKKKMDSIKVPSSLKQIETAFRNLNKLKLPSLTGIADNLNKLSKIKPPSLTSFVTQLTKLSQITKFPSITPLVNGLRSLSSLRIGPIIAKIQELNTALKKLEDRGGISAFKKFASDVSGMKTAFSSAASSMTQMNNKLRETGAVAQDAGLKLGTFAGKVQTVLTFRVISAAILSLNTAVTNGVSAIIEYDQALKDLQAITGATGLEVAQMGMKILEVASTTKFSASEVAQGMRTIGQAGFSASEAVETMQAVSDLATGTLSDMATTVDLVTTAMRVFRIDASQSAEVSDVFANAVNRSKLTIDKLRTAMNYVGPIARDSGISFKELAASMGTLANSGLRASTIGTGLRRVFAELIDPSKKLKEAIKGSGVAISELDPRANSLSTVLSNLGIVVDDASVAFDVFGKRGASAVLALTSQSSGFDKMLETIGRSGTAAQQAAIQMEGLGVSFKNMRDKAGLLAIAIGEAGVSKAMKIFVDVVRTLIDGLTFLVSSLLGKVIISLGLVTASVYALITAFNLLKVKAIFTGIVTGLQAVASMAILAETSVLGLLAAMAFNPITLAITATVAAITGLVWWMNKAKKAAEETALVADSYGELSKSMQDYALKTAGLSKNTKEYDDANKELRKALLKTADGYSDMTTEALAAALSIDPLTGKIKEGSKALEEYNKHLEVTHHKKLIAANDAINKSFERLKIPGKQLGFLGLEAKATGTQFEQARKQVAYLEGEVRTLSKSEKTLIADFHALEQQSIKNISKMKTLGKLNLNDTIDNFTRLSKAQGASGSVLESMLNQFRELQKENERTPKNLIEKWAVDGTNALSDLFDEYENLSGAFGEGKGIFGEDAQGVSEREIILKTEAAKKSLKIRYDSLNAESALLIANGKDEESVWRRHQEKLNLLESEAADIRMALSTNVAYQNLVILKKEQTDRAKILADNLVQNKNNAKERVRIEDEANAAYAKSREQLRIGVPADLDEQESQHKALLDTMKVNHAKHLEAIALAEAQGVLTSEQASVDKAQAEMLYYQNRETEARRYFKLIEGVEEAGGTNYDKRLKEVKAAEAKNYKERTDNLVKFNKIISDANEDRKDLDDDYAAESKKHSDKLTDIKEKTAKDFKKIDEDYAAKSLKISEDLTKAKIALEDSLLENKEKNTKEAYDLDLSAEDTIRGIKEKGMSDEAKQASQQTAANKKLAEGKRLVNQYYLWGDEANLANGKELVTQALGMVDAFSDQYTAIQLVKDSTAALKKISNYDKEIADLEAINKKKEAQAKHDREQTEAKKDYDTKVLNATTAIDKIIVAEDNRHKKEMQNQLDELGIYQQKVAEAKKLITLAGGTVPDTPSSNLELKESAETKALKERVELLGDIKKEKEAIVLIDKVIETVGADGIRSWTNKVVEATKEVSNLKKESNSTFSAIGESAENALGGIWEDVGEDGISTFREIKTSAEDTFGKIEEGVKGATTFTSVQESAEQAFDKVSDLSNGIDNVKSKTEEGLDPTPYVELADEVKTIKDGLDDVASSLDKDFLLATEVTGTEDIKHLSSEATDLSEELDNVNSKGEDVDVTPYRLLTDQVRLLKEELIYISTLDTVYDIIANVIGYDAVLDLISAIGRLKDKTITITTRHVTQGSSSGSSGSQVTRLAGGGRLPGFGGGDKNHALLEDGEWIINKYAVRKFGDDFMSSINNMTLPRFATGGKVGLPAGTGSASTAGPLETLIVRFQAGGLEAPVKITDPGSRASIKNMANELSKMRLTYAR